MSRRRLTMRQIREVLRYNFELELSYDKISKSLSISKGSVHNIIKRFNSSELNWPLSSKLSNLDLEETLFPSPQITEKEDPKLPDISEIHKELSRPHVTAQLLFEEYKELYPDGLSRSAYFRYLKSHKIGRGPTMKMIHKGGEKLFIDYSGDSVDYINPVTGEVCKTELFIASWGASSYCFADVYESQKKEDFIDGHIDAFNFFGVVPHVLIPDNLKSAVTKADLYDPSINKLYAKMAEHYNTVVIPARPRKPKDKAVVESNVLHIQRYILARLRNMQFFSLQEIKSAVSELLSEYNNRKMKDYNGQTRRERFLELDVTYAKELISKDFKYSDIKQNLKVTPNYHIRYNKHFYSVPFDLIGKKVDIYKAGKIIEIYFQDKHICRHLLGKCNFGYTTETLHMPPSHQHTKALSPEWLIEQAGKNGTNCIDAIKKTLQMPIHLDQAFRKAQGILRLAKIYSPERLEIACDRAKHFNDPCYNTIKSILENNLDKSYLEEVKAPENKTINHSNIRGPEYYKKEVETCI